LLGALAASRSRGARTLRAAVPSGSPHSWGRKGLPRRVDGRLEFGEARGAAQALRLRSCRAKQRIDISIPKLKLSPSIFIISVQSKRLAQHLRYRLLVFWR
jgi:hypothetical protein